MDSVHNPDRYMADLRQALSQGRKRIGVLVGAGAPMSICVNAAGELDANGKSLIPGVNQLTASILGGIKDDVKRNVVSTIHNELGLASNIETILSTIRLREKAIGSIKMYGLDAEGYRDLAKEICDAIGKVVSVALPKERCSYGDLISWITGIDRIHPLEIFTTNYDLLFEEAFEAVKAPYFDGFTGGAKPFFDPVSVAGNDLPARWSRLWKMHGSLGWSSDEGSISRSGNRDHTHMIYPDHLKYDLIQKQPYSALLDRLKAFISEPDTLLLCTGFSFRDAHICSALEEKLAANANSALFAFQYGNLAQEEPACLIALGRPNMSVYAADGAVINGVKGLWRPGEIPKNWEEIRASFWGKKSDKSNFLLGDFRHFSRFCALAQSSDLSPSTKAILLTEADAS